MIVLVTKSIMMFICKILWGTPLLCHTTITKGSIELVLVCFTSSQFTKYRQLFLCTLSIMDRPGFLSTYLIHFIERFLTNLLLKWLLRWMLTLVGMKTMMWSMQFMCSHVILFIAWTIVVESFLFMSWTSIYLMVCFVYICVYTLLNFVFYVCLYHERSVLLVFLSMNIAIGMNFCFIF